MAVNQHIKEIIDRIKFHEKITQSDISDEIGVSSTYLSDVINGRSPANDLFIRKIRNKYGKYFDDESEKNPVVKEQKTFGGSSPADALPLIPFDAIAGFPGPDLDSATLEQCERYAVPEFTAKCADFLIRVSGQSMTPTYNNGDILACRKIKDIQFFQWGNVYVLDTQQGVLVKRIFEDRTDETKIICRSDNVECFPEFKIPKDAIRSFSIVVGMIRME